MSSRLLEKLAGGAREWDTYRRLMAHTRPYLGRLALGSVFGVLFAGSTVSLLPALKTNFGHLVRYESITWKEILLFALVVPLLMLLRGLGAYVSAYLVQWVGNRVIMDLRIRVFQHLQQLSIAYFDRNRSGEAISRTVNDTAVLQNAVSTVLTDLVRQPLMLVGAVGYVLWLNWRLALLGIVVFPIFILPVRLFGRRVRRAARQGQERLADIVAIMKESVMGMRIVKAFGMEEREILRFSEQCRLFFGRSMRVVSAQAAMSPVTELLSAVGVVVAFGYAAIIHMPFEDFITFALALVVLYDPVKKLSRLHLGVQQSSASADRIFEILDERSTVAERPGALVLEAAVERIEFRGVSFSYGNGAVLEGIDLDVRAGERVALVGASGGGKTSLVSLLPRFFDPTEGQVLINGRDLREFSLHSLRRQFGLVTQDTILFNDTVAGNIAYGYPAASPEAIRDAAARAHAHDFVMRMPQGYDTMIGERGVRLSGGQRQRLAIARALLCNPPVLILDEATSALDTESERQVQEALGEAMQGRTVFAIAHRLSTIARCDRILVLGEGRVVEQGTHQELLAAGGIYKHLYDLQFQT